MDKYVGTDVGIYHVISECNHKDTDGHKLYNVVCRFCGVERCMRLNDIRYPKTCKHISLTGRTIDYSAKWSNQALKHVYHDMIRRCYSPNTNSARWYFEKGIRICDEWLDNPESFQEWALASGYQKGLTIDRINENGMYSPENCRWVTQSENSRRAGKSNKFDVNGEIMTGRQCSEFFQLGPNVFNKIERKYGHEIAQKLIVAMLKDPPQNKEKGVQQSWLSVYGISPTQQ